VSTTVSPGCMTYLCLPSFVAIAGDEVAMIAPARILGSRRGGSGAGGSSGDSDWASCC